MDVHYIGLLTAIGVAVFSLGVATVALLRCYFPPQTRAVMQLRDQLEEVADDNDRIHTRLTERAARENMAKARDRKGSAKDLAAEAQEVLREKIGATAGPETDVETQRAAYRRKLLQH